MSTPQPTVTIGICQESETDEVMSFIREHWSARHVLGQSRELLNWQHAEPAKGTCNFVVARDNDEGIIGILGFIPLTRYDNTLKGSGRETIWLTTWKVRGDHAHGLGLRLLIYLQTSKPQAWIGTVGLNPATRAIYNALGYETGTLTRFCLINPIYDDFRLAQVPVTFPTRLPEHGSTIFQLLPNNKFLEATDGLNLDSGRLTPLKTREYIAQRYLSHPFYKYQAFLATYKNFAGVLVTRLCSHNGRNALRIVDFLGAPEVLPEAGRAFSNMLEQMGAEYLDFFVYGLNDELSAAGLVDSASVEGLILPGHFEPFEPHNVSLLYSLRGPAGRRVLCKGDADQDRPNILEAPTDIPVLPSNL